MQQLPLSDEAQQLAKSLAQIEKKSTLADDTLHAEGVGGSLHFAYEQIRNAAEYSEQHLLMRRAIERFLRRTVNLNRPGDIGEELVIELTQARYLANDSVAHTTITQIDETMQQFAALYAKTLKHGQNKVLASKWIFQAASVQLEQMLVPQQRNRIFVDFAYQHYLGALDEKSLSQDVERHQYELAVYCAVHRTIFKSDIATIRDYGLSAQIAKSEGVDPIAYFVGFNRSLDELYQHKLTNHLVRLISQYGAPMRILREIALTDPNLGDLIQDKGRLLSRVAAVTQDQYEQVRQRLNKGIIRSVAFIAITKMLLGIGVEVPYDLVRHGQIVWQPLILNLLFPPLYMATLGASIRPPNQKNFSLIERSIERIMYQTGQPPVRYRLRRRVKSRSTRNFFDGLYGITFTLWLSALGYGLHLLGFNLVSGIIFFVFLSTVSFLGFRLTQAAREYELVESRRSALSFFADFFYTPFIRIGYWLSDTYARINVVTRVLDIMIEMPLKFILRFAQQWVGFLRDKQEEI